MLSGALPIRTAGWADAPALFEVHRLAVQTHCTPHYEPIHMERWFEGRGPDIYGPWLDEGRIWLAEEEERIVGFCGAVPGEITLLFVHPNRGGRGIGRGLMRYAMAQAATGHSGPLTVVATLNAVAFYERFGFKAMALESFTRGDPVLHYPVVRMVREVT